MFFFWIYSVTLLVSLLVGRYILSGTIEYSPYLTLTALLWVCTLIFIPIIRHIRYDMKHHISITSPRSLVSVGVLLLLILLLWRVIKVDVGFLQFLSILGLAIIIGVESRIFFVIALGGLIVTMISLVVELPTVAESASILVYLSLVIGVLTELVSPYFHRISLSSDPILQLSPDFRQGYHEALSEYSWMISFALQSLIVVLLIGLGRFWQFDPQLIFFLGIGIWIFFALFLLTTPRRYLIADVYTDDMKWFRWVAGRFTKNLIIITFSVITVLLVWSQKDFLLQASSQWAWVLLILVTTIISGYCLIFFTQYAKKRN